jgi:hypothetical protein
METKRTGETLIEAVNRMVGQWSRYNAARSKLNYALSSAQKFFESGTWHDEALWPWKDGQRPIMPDPERYVREGHKCLMRSFAQKRRFHVRDSEGELKP